MAQELTTYDPNKGLTTQLQVIADALEAAHSLSSGTGVPTIKRAHQLYADTSANDVIAQFSATLTERPRSLWMLEGAPLSIIPKTAVDADYTIPNGADDATKTFVRVTPTANRTITLPLIADTPYGIVGVLKDNATTDLVTITPNAADSIKLHKYQAITTEDIVLNYGGDMVWLFNDGSSTNWHILTHSIGGTLRVTSNETPYTATFFDRTIWCDAAVANLDITLRNPLKTHGQVIRLVKIDSSANTVTIDPDSANINGSATKVLSAQWDSVTVVACGNQYYEV